MFTSTNSALTSIISFFTIAIYSFTPLTVPIFNSIIALDTTNPRPTGLTHCQLVLIFPQ